MAKNNNPSAKEIEQFLKILNKPYGFGKSLNSQWKTRYEHLMDKFGCGYCINCGDYDYMYFRYENLIISSNDGVYGKFEVENG